MALMVGVGVALALELADTRLRHIDGVQTALGIPVLATVPDVAALKGEP
jgi:capsular polysaccharide biosynthesis protein